MKKVRLAVIPVAGYGTRFLPFTKAVPKPMLPILNRPAIEIIAKEAADSGIEEIVFVVGHKKEILQDHFSPCEELERVLKKGNKQEFLNAIKFPETIAKVHFVVQEKQRGTADAIMAAESFIGDQPFAVLFGDDVMYNKEKPVLKQLIDLYDKTQKTVIGVKTVPHEDVPKYASVEFDSQNGREYHVTTITEKPPLELVKSDISPLGRYVCTPNMVEIMRNLKPGAGGEYQLTDALDIEARTNGAYAYEFEGIRYDMGDRLGYLKANVEFGLRDEKLSKDFLAYLKELVKD